MLVTYSIPQDRNICSIYSFSPSRSKVAHVALMELLPIGTAAVPGLTQHIFSLLD